jgi:hypothetical protein
VVIMLQVVVLNGVRVQELDIQKDDQFRTRFLQGCLNASR